MPTTDKIRNFAQKIYALPSIILILIGMKLIVFFALIFFIPWPLALVLVVLVILFFVEMYKSLPD